MIIEGRKLSSRARATQEKVFYVLLALNILFPVVTGIVLVPFNIDVESGSLPSTVLIYLITFAPVLTGVMQIVSGVFLMIGVFNIRKYFKQRDQDGQLDIKTLVLHSSAFGLYLLSAVVGYTSYTVYALNSENAVAFA